MSEMNFLVSSPRELSRRDRTVKRGGLLSDLEADNFEGFVG